MDPSDDTPVNTLPRQLRRVEPMETPREHELDGGAVLGWSAEAEDLPAWAEIGIAPMGIPAREGRAGRFDLVRIITKVAGEEVCRFDAWIAWAWERRDIGRWDMNVVLQSWSDDLSLSHCMLRGAGERFRGSKDPWEREIVFLSHLLGEAWRVWQARIGDEGPKKAYAHLIRRTVFANVPPMLIFSACDEVMDELEPVVHRIRR